MFKIYIYNPVPLVYLYFALVQLLSTLITNEDITLALRYSEDIYLKEEEKERYQLSLICKICFPSCGLISLRKQPKRPQRRGARNGARRNGCFRRLWFDFI